MKKVIPRALEALALVALLGGCAAEVVIVDGSGGGSSASTSKATSANASTGTGGSCKSHDDCPGGLCLFGIGLCAKSCEAGDFCGAACGPGSECNACATSSCPACDDCKAACVPIQAERCDIDDPCTGGKVCLWESHTCAPPCTVNGACTSPGLSCVSCASSSCCGCKDCASACLPELE